MKILLDTNVLASATATRGLCADVVLAVLAEHELVVSPQILQELQRVLDEKFSLPAALIQNVLRLFRQDAIMAKVEKLPKVRLKDKDDLGILAAAVSAHADVIVTGDKELQKLGHIQKIQILSPRQFWEMLAEPY
jgi:putative PIN family toxin of toxin-antitoxin system